MSFAPTSLFSGLVVTVFLGGVASPTPLPVESRLAEVRAAFLTNDPDQLALHFPASGRVLVTLTDLDVGDWFGPGPVRALLRRLTEETPCLAFDYVPEPTSLTPSRNSRMVYAKARWTYRESASGAVRFQDVYLSLQRSPEDGEWRIVELRAVG